MSTLSAAVMADMGINTYYAPVIPRGTVYNNTDEVIAATLDVNTVLVEHAEEITASDQVVIVSRHPGTVELLQDMYPNNTLLASITPDDISGKDVVGTLPPYLIQYAGRFKAVAIRDFDYSKDGDLAGDELRTRMVMTSTIRVSIS